MKNNFNPYSVPDNFFEDTFDQAISKYHSRKRAFKYCALSLIVAAVIFVVPMIIESSQEKVLEKQLLENNLAQMYEYDIFLQVNF